MTTIRHLKIFSCVAKHLSMSKAAQELYISQPSISQAIKELENHYQIQLFERLGKRLYITSDGELLLKYAIHILDSYNELEDSLKQLANKPHLKVGSSISVGTCLLPKLMHDFQKTNAIKVQAVVKNTSEIESLLATSEIDIAIVEGEITNKDLIEIPLLVDELVLVVGKQHPLAKLSKVSIEDLNNQDLLIREKGSGVRELFMQCLVEHNINMQITFDSTNTEAIKEACMQGLGIGVFARVMMNKEGQNKKLSILEVADIKLTRTIRLVVHKNKFKSKALEAFINYSKAYLNN